MEPGYTVPDLTLLGENHIAEYLRTDGDIGAVWNGVPALVLTTIGRKTGHERQTALICGRDGDCFIVIASVGGGAKHPAWYLNLVAHPHATIQYRADRISVTARTAEGEERARLWQLMCDQWPNYDVYQARTERRIPVVVLEPTAEDPGTTA